MKCWICKKEGTTGEHMIKASDLRSHFKKIDQKNPIFFHTDGKRSIPIGSYKSKKLKFDSLICNKCNSSISQPYDRAWETLSAYLRSNRGSLLKKCKKVKLKKVFPGTVHKNMLFVHLYFVKIFGCKIVESGAPIPTEPFSQALLNNMAHEDIFIAFGPITEKTNQKYAGLSRIQLMKINGLPDFANFLYIIDKLAVNILYVRTIKDPIVMKNTWHPHNLNKNISLKIF